ncbi:SIS domain-containing protein [Siccirubricoccus sp. G192]|uniref:D-sedoheptulose-7-phosphate isomerase n=1 Tax=Siccirubricoccus sp. G192 TaxID=2849651 RepID=UPI001C2B8D5C|nr:SIS domain-containing protein [Siccirubricoccus sp. G192]MBV1795917.1 SIS domain-containing protein [Siccirubricoccus sp. G192]
MIALDAWLSEAEALLAATRGLGLDAAMEAAVRATAGALAAGRPLLVCGNGGSAADAQHIVGEMVGRFLRERRALRAICLSSNPAVLTAWSNDYSFETVFSRQVEAYAEPGGVLLGLSTSGNSPNVVLALEAARARGMVTIGLTGQGGGRMAPLCDHLLAVPSTSTPAIQQVHLCLYHCFCAAVEDAVVEAGG